MTHQLEKEWDYKESIWKGVYHSFEEASGDSDAFDIDIWINKQKQDVLKKHQSLNEGATIPDIAVSKDYPLPLVISMLSVFQKSVSVLDFGGGMGGHYFEILAKVPSVIARLNYTIVEKSTVIQQTPEEIRKINALSFFDDIHDIQSSFDIVHIGSALQYVDDWQGLIKNLIEITQAKFFVFSDLVAGDIPTFVTLQYYYGKKIPMRFFNDVEFLSFMKTLGFEVSYQSKYYPIQGYHYYPNKKLPERYRLRSHANLVFSLE